MLLDLPNELLTTITSFLAPEDCSTLRKTCKHLRGVVDANGILPLSPDKVEIDFGKKVIVTSCNGKKIGVFNGDIRSRDHPQHICRSLILKTKPQVFCDVGYSWEDYLKIYLSKLNKHSKEHIKMTVHLHENEIPEVLRSLKAKLSCLSLHPPSTYVFMPPELENWVSQNLPSDSLHLGFLRNASDLQKHMVPEYTCFTNDDGASYALLEMDWRHVDNWIFIVVYEGPKFPEAMKRQFDVDLAELPVSMKPTWVFHFEDLTVRFRRINACGSEMVQMTIRRNDRT